MPRKKTVVTTHTETETITFEGVQEATFWISGNLIHSVDIKRITVKASEDELKISTDCGAITINCSTPEAYFIYKDENGKAACRVMTPKEEKKYSKLAG